MMMAYGKDYEVSYIVSINFRANLDAQNAGNCISGLQISNIFWGSMPPDPPRDSCVVLGNFRFATATKSSTTTTVFPLNISY